MSQESVEIVRRAYEAVTARLELPQELFHSDWELDVTDVSPEAAGVLHGLEATEEMRPYWETFDDFHVEIEEVIHADEEQVVDAVRDGGQTWSLCSRTSAPSATKIRFRLSRRPQ